MEMAQDPHEWIRQECGRSLARYFDTHKQQSITNLHQLLMRGSNLLVIEQISYSAQDLLIKQAFSALAHIMNVSSEEEMLTLLNETVEVLEEMSNEDIDLGE